MHPIVTYRALQAGRAASKKTQVQELANVPGDRKKAELSAQGQSQ